MHGELLKACCCHCGRSLEWHADLSNSTPCPGCLRAGGMRPDIVWFGDMPKHMERIARLLEKAGVFAAIGTSGHVYPAAGFVDLAADSGAATLEINNTATAISNRFDRHLTGPATVQVTAWVAECLASPRG
jgi:NAD-dependent deacetylase